MLCKHAKALIHVSEYMLCMSTIWNFLAWQVNSMWSETNGCPEYCYYKPNQPSCLLCHHSRRYCFMPLAFCFTLSGFCKTLGYLMFHLSGQVICVAYEIAVVFLLDEIVLLSDECPDRRWMMEDWRFRLTGDWFPGQNLSINLRYWHPYLILL